MALSNRSPKTYLSLMGGKVVLKVKPDTEGAVPRVNKNNETVYEKLYSDVTGFLTSLESKDGDYGKQWVLTIEDGGTEYILQFPYSGGYAGSFFRALPNVDFSKQITFSPYSKTTVGENGVAKTKSSLYLNQDGKSVQWFFTKEHPNGIPEMRKVKVKGVEAWDDSEQLDFFEELLRTEITPKIEEAAKNRKFSTAYVDAVIETHRNSMDAPETDDMTPLSNDDLPF